MPIGQSQGDSAQPLTLYSAAERFAEQIPDSWVEDNSNAAAEPKKAKVEKTAKVEQTEPEATSEPEVEEQAAPEGEDEVVESEGEDEPEADAEPPKHKVKVRGQELEVTLEEALNGYSRTEDYTRDKMKLAEDRKTFLAEQNSIRAERQHAHGVLTEFENQLKALVVEPDWDKLRTEYPESYNQVHAAWLTHKGKLDAVAAEKTKLETQLRSDAERDLTEHLTAEGAKLVAAVPAWTDEAVATKEMNELQDYARTSLGFSDAELDGITDHRAVLMLRKAMLYDRGEKQKAEAAEKAKPKIERVRTAEPGTAPQQKGRQVTEVTRRKQRLAKTHSLHDAAAVLELSLPD